MDKDVYVILEDIRSALNVGAIFRTCDAAGVKKLFLTGITPYPPHNKIPKTALGAIELVDWEYNKNTAEVISQLKEQGVKIISVELAENSKNIYTFNFDFPIALVFGHEISGVSPSTLESSDGVVSIPMLGKKESLNVATSCGIALYETVRHRLYK